MTVTATAGAGHPGGCPTNATQLLPQEPEPGRQVRRTYHGSKSKTSHRRQLLSRPGSMPGPAFVVLRPTTTRQTAARKRGWPRTFGPPPSPFLTASNPKARRAGKARPRAIGLSRHPCGGDGPTSTDVPRTIVGSPPTDGVAVASVITLAPLCAFNATLPAPRVATSPRSRPSRHAPASPPPRRR